MRRNLESAKREMRLEDFRLNGTGTAALAEGQFRGTLVDNGLGDYTITFAEPFGRTPTCVATPLTADTAVSVAAISNTSVQVLCTDLASAAKDADLMLMVVGSEGADQQ